MAYVAGMDADSDEPDEILAWCAENRESDIEEDGFSRAAKIEALFSLQLQNMAGSVDANEKDAAALEKRMFEIMNNGAFWSRQKLALAAKPDYNKDDPQQNANMDAAFAKLLKRKDVAKFDKDQNVNEGRGRWSFIQRVKSADTGK